MVPEKIISQIETWITNVLDTPNNKFGNLPPCPYAKKAWVELFTVISTAVACR